MSKEQIVRLKGIKGRKMQPAIDYANKNGFQVVHTNNSHLSFRKDGGQIIASSTTPRSERPARHAITGMRRHLNGYHPH